MKEASIYVMKNPAILDKIQRAAEVRAQVRSHMAACIRQVERCEAELKVAKDSLALMEAEVAMASRKLEKALEEAEGEGKKAQI